MTFIYSPPQDDIKILYIDDCFVIVNKPSGLLSVPGRAEEHKDCLETRLKSLGYAVMTVHRLDMDTSGLMVFALHKEAHKNLSKQFELKQTQKTYVCLVDGHVGADEGEIDLPLRCDWPNRPLQMVDHELGKKALTKWRVLERLQEGTTRLELTPITGRSHQLRVHCLSMGHAILGDRFYGSDEVVNKAKRLCLHAQALSFHHPETGELMSYDCPADF
ncbi:pseudouridine synthase for 23S rRNA (position 746) and tRNAphe(position 32) [Candidatus Terasakiella magnetica]|uniref:Pseudouridine synthase n=1 Tax=Candidatus Terasakiella magnetica TaxID=1867952 RepID=A0A1C3RKJ4_9PROT|nr:RluA family pseudouridine synthase [Candidatus Terasakiella magnetica]SCA57768.1 pseudouridine synthase for 23S rRNA (position 746) and tRNAphe(position 32) [Candidatus Terasakiella magnetica]